jgi:hypothetical protein
MVVGSTKGSEMTDQDSFAISNDTLDRRAPVIETDGLVAEYSTGCTPTGEWFALGTIVSERGTRTMPAWVVVGTGTSMEEAVDSLALEVRSQAQAMLV